MVRATIQPTASASRRGSSSRTAIPSQSAIGGTLRAKCWARWSWSPARIEAPHSPASRSTSYSDASRAIEMPTSARCERQRDERRDGQARAPPAELGDDDRDARRPAPEERPLLCALACTSRGYLAASAAELVREQPERVEPPGEIRVARQEERSLAHPRQVARARDEGVDARRQRPAAVVGVKICRERPDGAVVNGELAARIAAGCEEEQRPAPGLVQLGRRELQPLPATNASTGSGSPSSPSSSRRRSSPTSSTPLTPSPATARSRTARRAGRRRTRGGASCPPCPGGSSLRP